MSDVLEKLAEYAAIATPNIWLFDPLTLRMYTYGAGALQEIAANTIGTTDASIQLTRADIFQD